VLFVPLPLYKKASRFNEPNKNSKDVGDYIYSDVFAHLLVPFSDLVLNGVVLELMGGKMNMRSRWSRSGTIDFKFMGVQFPSDLVEYFNNLVNMKKNLHTSLTLFSSYPTR
jgi:hypothetical protein